MSLFNDSLVSLRPHEMDKNYFTHNNLSGMVSLLQKEKELVIKKAIK